MAKITAKTTVDPSDSDLSLQLSEGSSLSSDSDITIKKKQKPKKKKKTKKKYCVCRKGYDGKEFMIECDDCKEWFHGDCIGLKPNSVTDNYFCDACTAKRKPKPLIILPPQPPQPALPTTHEEDDDDICVLCDGDCTCGDAVEEEKPKLQTKIIIPVPKKRLGKSISKSKKMKHQQRQSDSSDMSSCSSDSEDDEEKRIKPKKGKKLMTKLPLIKSSSDEDEEVIIDDLDDLLETMSPLSDHTSSSENSLSLENQEFFTDDDEINATTSPSVHIDSGDDEDLEDEETKQIIQSFHSDDDLDDDEDDEDDLEDSDDEDSEEEVNSFTYVEDNYESEDQDEEEIPYGYSNHWSSSDDELDDEIEFDYIAADSDENQQANPFLPLLDTYNPASFMNVGEDTPMDELSAFEIANALTALSATEQREEHTLRRPSLPSNALSAARRMRGSQDINTSETLRALSNIDMPLSLHPIEEEKEDVKKKEQESIDLSVLSSFMSLLKTSNQQQQEKETDTLSKSRLPKPSTSTSTSLEQQIEDVLNITTKRKAGTQIDDTNKRRKSRSNSLGAIQQHLQPLVASSFSTPASPAAIIDELEDIMTTDQDEEEALAVSMDDLVDTSQLYSTSLSPELEDDPYSKDLSRWQRIPIGAFRLMRSKNKLWLER